MSIKINLENLSIGVIGLGYVGLPLAAKFGELYNVLGFDVSSNRVEDLQQKGETHEELPVPFPRVQQSVRLPESVNSTSAQKYIKR